MLTAIVWDARAPRPLALTLATLVPAAVEGALREVVVMGTADGSDERFVADQAGCRLGDDSLPAREAALCKGLWLLLVRSGDRLPPGWLDAVLEHGAKETAAARVPVDNPTTVRWRYWLGAGPTALLFPRDRASERREPDWASFTQSVRGRRLRIDRRAFDRS